MFPILFSIGGFHVYSLSVALIFAWLVFSFMFWRSLRSQGVGEERIFDLTFYSTLCACIVSRLAFVLANWDIFRNNPLRIAAVWIFPGMSVYGALLGGLLLLVYLSRGYKVRVGHVLDAFGVAFGAASIIGAAGALLDGSYVGSESHLPWAVHYVGHIGTRHPVQLYEMIAVGAILLGMIFLSRRASIRKWPYGLLGLWFFALYSTLMFVLEFFRDTRVYLGYLRANQWVLVALFAETMGAFYVRGGGRERLRPFINKVIGVTYGKFSK